MRAKNNRLVNRLFFHESWDIMIIKNNKPHKFPTNTLDILNNTTAQQLKKKYTFQADPFIIERDNKVYIFYEALSFLNSKGILRCRILDANLVELDDVKLEGFDHLQCHLSFPFLFYSNDQLFMIPESSERKEVILFQSLDFPTHWKQINVLLSDIALTDNVLLARDGHFYLLSTTMEDTLTLHTADAVSGPWQRITPELHVCNEHHRGAGSPHTINEKMYFLTQECTPETYGKSIYIKELITLNASTFTEAMTEQIHPSINQSEGVHTLNFTDNYIVYDTKKLSFSLFSIFKKISYKCMIKYRSIHLSRKHQ